MPGHDGFPGIPGPRGPIGMPGLHGIKGEPGVWVMAARQTYAIEDGIKATGQSSKCNDDLLCEGQETDQQELLNPASGTQNNSTNEGKKLRDGSKQAPATTCLELKKMNPFLPSGMYWIDPNGWDPKDAVSVYCDMEKGRSCLVTSPNKSESIQSAGEGTSSWLSNLSGGIQISYKISKNQLASLQKISDRASQNITIASTLQGTRLIQNTTFKPLSISLLGYNDAIISPSSSKTLRYQSSVDGLLEQLDINYSSTRTERLPIMDVDLEEALNPSNGITITIGSVCFY